jgi:hypothetical protein
MHILALICGIWLHIVGDFGLLLTGVVAAMGRQGYVYGEVYEYPSRAAAAFELLPVPVILSLAGLIIAHWGITGLRAF